LLIAWSDEVRVWDADSDCCMLQACQVSWAQTPGVCCLALHGYLLLSLQGTAALLHVALQCVVICCPAGLRCAVLPAVEYAVLLPVAMHCTARWQLCSAACLHWALLHCVALGCPGLSFKVLRYTGICRRRNALAGCSPACCVACSAALCGHVRHSTAGMHGMASHKIAVQQCWFVACVMQQHAQVFPSHLTHAGSVHLSVSLSSIAIDFSANEAAHDTVFKTFHAACAADVCFHC
jgi:hypothetical protein